MGLPPLELRDHQIGLLLIPLVGIEVALGAVNETGSVFQDDAPLPILWLPSPDPHVLSDVGRIDKLGPDPLEDVFVGSEVWMVVWYVHVGTLWIEVSTDADPARTAPEHIGCLATATPIGREAGPGVGIQNRLDDLIGLPLEISVSALHWYSPGRRRRA